MGRTGTTLDGHNQTTTSHRSVQSRQQQLRQWRAAGRRWHRAQFHAAAAAAGRQVRRIGRVRRRPHRCGHHHGRRGRLGRRRRRGPALGRQQGVDTVHCRLSVRRSRPRRPHRRRRRRCVRGSRCGAGCPCRRRLGAFARCDRPRDAPLAVYGGPQLAPFSQPTDRVGKARRSTGRGAGRERYRRRRRRRGLDGGGRTSSATRSPPQPPQADGRDRRRRCRCPPVPSVVELNTGRPPARGQLFPSSRSCRPRRQPRRPAGSCPCRGRCWNKTGAGQPQSKFGIS